MIGAIYGDIIGSVYEHNATKSEDFALLSDGSTFTDDTVLTVAVAEALLYRADHPQDRTAPDALYAARFRQYYARYPDAGYGGMFIQWAQSRDAVRNNSYGNGAAMRVSPIGYAFDGIEEVLREAKASCTFTHNHPDAIAGAQATAACVYLARQRASKQEIKTFVQRRFRYDLSFSLESIRSTYGFEIQTSKCVPPCIVAFLESHDYESAIRKVISLGGDSDTMACITGGIAHAFYQEMPSDLHQACWNRLDSGLRKTIQAFSSKYSI